MDSLNSVLMELTVINVFVLMDLLVNCVILALITALANLVVMVQHATTFKVRFLSVNWLVQILQSETPTGYLCTYSQALN